MKSSASVGNAYGVWQNQVYADADKSRHQQVLETRMMYGTTYCYADVEKSSHQQGLETRMLYGRTN
jgi:hypothetical protein